MSGLNHQVMREFLAEASFRGRDQAKLYQAEALVAGKRRQASAWGAHARKVEREIVKYGMVRPIVPRGPQGEPWPNV